MVIGRREGECVQIITKSGEEIYVWVKDIKNGRMRLGIECDREVQINREHDHAVPHPTPNRHRCDAGIHGEGTNH